MQLLNDDALQPGDIILTSAPGKASRFIRAATHSKYSHAMLYIASNCAVHSELDGVHVANLQRMEFSPANEPLVLRLKSLPNQDVIRTICDYARSQIGTQYSIPQAAVSAVARKRQSTRKRNRQFCSRLVAEAYAEASIQLVGNPSFCFPSDLINYDLLVQLGSALRRLNPADARHLVRPNPLQAQINLTNELFRRMREASAEDVQTHDQVVECLLRRPELDEVFSEIVLSIGYLDMWQIELATNPWRYDSTVRESTSISEELRLWEVQESIEDVRRFRQSAHDYAVLFKSTRRQYFFMMRAFYEDLFFAHCRRWQLATGNWQLATGK